MELDELRARWQQSLPPPELPDNLSEAALRQLLARGAGSPVARLERNLWLELGFTGLIMAGCLAALPVVKDAFWHAWLVLLLLVCVVTLPYYARKRQLLRRLRDPHGSVREHTRRQVSSLRGMMRYYYRLTMWSIPVWLSLSLFFAAKLFERQLHGPKAWLLLSILGGGYLLIGTFMYFLMRSFTRQWLQKLYGQHFDQLEQSLAELAEPAPDVSP